MSDKNQTQVSTAAGTGDAGYNKALKNRHIQMIAIGGLIGTGLFLGIDGYLTQDGPVLVFAYAVCGIFAFLMVRALGELAVHRPSSGAFVSYTREFLGEKGAFVTGWFFSLDWTVTVMANITAVAPYMRYWPMFESVLQWVIALVVLTLVFVFNTMSVKVFGEAESWFAMVKVTTILTFIGVAIWAIITQAHTGEYTASLHNISESGDWFPEGLVLVFALTLGVVFVSGGTEMVGVAVGEAKDAATILPKTINSMVVCIPSFYVGSAILFALALFYNVYSSNESPFITLPFDLGVSHTDDIIQVVALIVVLSSLNADLYATDHTLRSMAFVGKGPCYVARLNKNHAPYGGIIITVSLGLLGVLLNAFVPENASSIVTDLAGIGITGTWAVILISYPVSLRKAKRDEEQHPEFRMLGAPYTNYLALLFLAVVVASNVTSESGRQTLTLFAVVVVLVVAGWYYVRGRVGNLTDEVAVSLQGEETLVAGD